MTNRPATRLSTFARVASLLLALVVLCLTSACASAKSRSEWDGVERIVAVGDVHGDYNQFVRVLTDAGVIDDRLKWAGGKTHLVQVGDMVDRGPDSRKAIDLLIDLEKQAKRKGGYVHALIGNHEAMNVTGDLRYVHPGEYAAFAGRRSESLQSNYYRQVIDYIKSTTPEEQWPVFDAAYEANFRKVHPLGFVEHRRAWEPRGRYGRWVIGHNTVIRINDTLFVHGGLSGKYAALSLDDLNEQVRDELKNPSSVTAESTIRDAAGPLWYRGLAMDDPDSAEAEARLDAMLENRNAQRIVVAHTPITGSILPRFDGRVIVVDVGLAAHYGARVACLVIEGNELYALHRGQRIDLPNDDDAVEAFLRRAASLDPEPSPVSTYLEQLKQQAIEQAQEAKAAAEGG